MKIFVTLIAIIWIGYIVYFVKTCKDNEGNTVLGIGQFHCIDRSVLK